MFRIFKKDKQESVTDEALVTLWAKHSDHQALGQLYARYISLIYGICLKYLKDPQASEDAVMQVYEQVQKKLAESDVVNFKAWVCTVARNHCLMELRKAKNNKVDHLDPTEAWQLDRHATDLGFSDERETLLTQMEKCIELLVDAQKQMVRMFYLEEFSYQQISEQTQTPLGMVRSHIQNGRRNLRNCMGEPTSD
jgi:RNA polymerase sigma factor (sigma-70 family)